MVGVHSASGGMDVGQVGASPGVGGELGAGAFDTCRHLQLSNRHANKHQVNESAYLPSTTDSVPKRPTALGNISVIAQTACVRYDLLVLPSALPVSSSVSPVQIAQRGGER
jgi:hypothetical protein